MVSRPKSHVHDRRREGGKTANSKNATTIIGAAITSAVTFTFTFTVAVTATATATAIKRSSSTVDVIKTKARLRTGSKEWTRVEGALKPS